MYGIHHSVSLFITHNSNHQVQRSRDSHVTAQPYVYQVKSYKLDIFDKHRRSNKWSVTMFSIKFNFKNCSVSEMNRFFCLGNIISSSLLEGHTVLLYTQISVNIVNLCALVAWILHIPGFWSLLPRVNILTQSGIFMFRAFWNTQYFLHRT